MGGLKNRFAWSTRRGNVFDECRRKYWFEYYGHWGGWDPGSDPRTREIYILKQLKGRQAWMGAHVHEAVSEALHLIHAGLPADPEEIAEERIEIMRREFRQSREKRYRKTPKKAAGLIEHEFDVPVPQEEWKDLGDRARRCILHFFDSPPLKELRELDRAAWLEVEELQEFQVDGHAVYVKLDVAYRPEKKRLVIVDWKTGKVDPHPDPLQLACYAIYAMERWKVRPEEIETVNYNLAEAAEVRWRVEPDLVERTRARIRESLQGMLQYVEGGDSLKNVPLPEKEFPVTRNTSACRRCAYRKLCTDSPLWK